MKSKLAPWSLLLTIFGVIISVGITLASVLSISQTPKIVTLMFIIVPILPGFIISIIGIRNIKKYNLEGGGITVSSLVISIIYLSLMLNQLIFYNL